MGAGRGLGCVRCGHASGRAVGRWLWPLSDHLAERDGAAGDADRGQLRTSILARWADLSRTFQRTNYKKCQEKHSDIENASTIGSSPAIATPKPWFIVQFALPAKSSEPGLRTAISKHVDRKIAVALLAALIVPSLKPLLDFVGFLGNRFNKVMRLPAVGHAIQSLAQQTIDGRHGILAEIEFIEADHLDAKALQHLLAFKILRREIHPPRR